MSKILVVGDLHTKTHILNKAINKFKREDFDEIIFLGDYVDDWSASPNDSRMILDSLVSLKTKYGNKVTLLLGNHDLSEYISGRFTCSGYNFYTSLEVKLALKDNESLFDIACSRENILFSHAGITNKWKKYAKINAKTPQKIANALNDSFHYRYTNQKKFEIFKKLSEAGEGRGGSGIASPIWADITELVADPLDGIHQVVGHTPVKSIRTEPTKDGNSLIFCDTCSTYPDGRFIGNCEFLELKM